MPPAKTRAPRPLSASVNWPALLVGGGLTVGALALLLRQSMGLKGTIFTIVFENKNRSDILGSGHAPYFDSLAAQSADLTNYRWPSHPSLPAYIAMTSGTTQGITDDVGHVIPGTDHLAAQMDAAGIPWRAYAEGMPAPCSRAYQGRYMPRHMPFVYYQSVLENAAACDQHVVPYEPYFAQDLASDQYRYMWLTPDACNDMHDCAVSTGDAWLSRVMPLIQASPGYRRGGVVFILFDEGRGSSQLATLIVSPLLRQAGQVASAYSHASYLATVEDLLGLPRLPATRGVASMAGLLNT